MLPIFQTKDQSLSLLQTRWASQLNPLLSSPLLKGRVLSAVALLAGDNTIDHGLGAPLQGWIVIRQYNAYAGLYDKQSSNNMPELTLILNSTGSTTVDLYVF